MVKMSKPVRDTAAPKRNLSAYLLYQNAMRDMFKAQNPGMTFGQLSKYTSSMYNQMPLEEKKEWEARAEADKARYFQQLSEYTPPPGYDARGDAIIGYTLVPGKKGKRDENAPKRCLPPYMLYQNAMREQFKQENPGMSFGQLSTYTSHMYKALSAEEKAVWEARAAEDKARYDQELQHYVPPPGHDSAGNLFEEAVHGKKSKKAKDHFAPKRARGSFVFFASDARPQILAQYPTIKFTAMGSILGERWRALSNEQKAHYEALANQDKERFSREMEEYNRNKTTPATIAIPTSHQGSVHDIEMGIHQKFAQSYHVQAYQDSPYASMNQSNYYYDPYGYH